MDSSALCLPIYEDQVLGGLGEPHVSMPGTYYATIIWTCITTYDFVSLHTFFLCKKKDCIMEQSNPPPSNEPKKKRGRPRSDLPYCELCRRLLHKCFHGQQDKVEEEGEAQEGNLLTFVIRTAI
jgi:hypothetical protein